MYIKVVLVSEFTEEKRRNTWVNAISNFGSKVTRETLRNFVRIISMYLIKMQGTFLLMPK